MVIPATPAISYNGTLSRWEYSYTKRNKTQPELDAYNQMMRDIVKDTRKEAYQNESDGIFWSSERNETTKQEWLDKVDEIKAANPYPDPIVIPE